MNEPGQEIADHLRHEHGIPMHGDAPEAAVGAFHLGLHLPRVGIDPGHEHDYTELIDRIPELAALKDLPFDPVVMSPAYPIPRIDGDDARG